MKIIILHVHYILLLKSCINFVCVCVCAMNDDEDSEKEEMKEKKKNA